MRIPMDWSLDHTDIAGGIIQTPRGDYEVTRVIGEPSEFEAVRADVRLMSSAPALLRAAVDVLAVARETSEELRQKVSEPIWAAWGGAVSELSRAVERATGSSEGPGERQTDAVADAVGEAPEGLGR